MAIRKSNPFISIANSYVVDAPEPANISYFWNLGSLLGTCLVIQLATGIFLAMHYSSNLDLAFISVQHIMIDVNYGWLIRYAHSNGAGFFFIFVYIHMARGIYYGSYKKPRIALWSIGVIIFLLMIITAFMGYCLVYGQMSHWGATVITNLVTAVPYLGTDIAEFLLINYYFKYGLTSNKLNTIGKVNKNARKKPRTISDEYYLNIPTSFLSLVVGLIDGDGYIHIGNSGKNFIKLNLVISLHENDLPLLEYIQSILKLGTITVYPKHKVCKLIIYRTDLQEIFFPLLQNKDIFFLTKIRNEQYHKALYILNNNISLYDKIDYIYDTVNNITYLPKEYLQLHFYNNWLIGFIIAEGSFNIKKSNEAFFNLKQRTHLELFESFKLLFNTNVKLYIEKDKYIQFAVSSKKDLQSVINFISFEGNIPLNGLKLIQYQKWIKQLKEIPRYKSLNFPNV